MPKINIPNNYTIEVAPPDISEYATGNTGIPYIWSFEGAAPGPHVMISAIIHGNEPAGAIALDWLLKKEIKPIAGRMTFAFMNIEAYQSFSADDPNASRWADEDMNRVWDTAVLDGDRTSSELVRARQVRPILDQVDFLFDIHTMQHPASPLMMTGRHNKATKLAAKIGIPERVVADFGHKSGKRMRDYAAFDDEGSNRAALLVECGQHWMVSAGHLARESSLRFLLALGTIDAAHAEKISNTLPEQKFYSVETAITIETDNFKFEKNFLGGEIISNAGTVIAYDGDHPVRTPVDNVMLVMPSRRLWPGVTAVRLASQVEKPA